MTRDKAQQLILVLKRIIQTGVFLFPEQGKRGSLDLRSVFSESDRFIVDINRHSKIKKDKYTLLLRYGRDQGLIRIDVGGPQHENPDGTKVQCPHIHIQQKDTGAWDAWAYELPAVFCDVNDHLQTLRTFLEYCNVNNISSIEICEQKEME